MNDFSIWFTTGMEHIMDWKGYDHMLFLTALCAPYSYREWKKLAVLITAFTLGHSLTLALSVLDIVKIKTSFIEFLIPLTILFTALTNLISLKKSKNRQPLAAYSIAAFFGLIHGLGFSFLLKSLLGREASILFPLLSFNLGIEAGQIIIVSAILLFSVLLTQVFRLPQRSWNAFLSSAAGVVALIMAIQRLPELF